MNSTIDKKLIQEKLTEVRKKSKGDNFLLIKLEYNEYMIVPYADGIKIVEGMKQAEMLHRAYDKPERITPFEKDKLIFSVMSREDYEAIKVAQLLGIKPEDVIAAINGIPNNE